MKQVALTFGEWAPDHPSFGGFHLGAGGGVVLEDAHGVYATLGGYRPLIGPGTLLGAFGSTDFPEHYTPNTMPSSAQPKIWLDDQDRATIAHVANPYTNDFITAWANKITGEANSATFLYKYPSLTEYYISLQYIGQSSIDPSVFASGEGTQDGGAMDIVLSAPYTGTILWCLVVLTDVKPQSSGLLNEVLIEFGNAGEVATAFPDSAAIRRNGGNRALEITRSGETAAVGTTVAASNQPQMTFVIFDGTNKIIRINGAEASRTSSTAAFDISRLRIGGPGDLENQPGSQNPANDFAWWGATREIVFGTGPISTADVEKLEGWLVHKRGLQGLLPASHPYKTAAPQTAAMPTANEPTSTGVFWSKEADSTLIVGDYGKLFRLSPAFKSFDDVTKSGFTYSSTQDEPWQFTQFGNRVIATTRFDKPQYYDLGVSARFDDLPGNPPLARACAQVRDFIFLGDVEEAGVRKFNRVRWSGFDNSEDWTTDPGGTQADFQDLEAQYGEITAIIGGEFAAVFQQRAINRFTYVGPPAIFQRDLLETNRGAIAPLSVIRVGRLVYFYAYDGFWAFDGVSTQRISGDLINRWTRRRIDDVLVRRMRAGHDPHRRIIVWAWPYDPDGNNSPTAGLQLIYNYEMQRWSYNYDGQLRWWFVEGPSESQYVDSNEEQDPIDGSAALIDTYSSVQSRPVAISYDGELWRVSKLNGGDLPARLETTKVAVSIGERSLLTGGRVIGNITSASAIKVAAQSEAAYPSNSLTSETAASQFGHHLFEDGYVPLDSEGRYHGLMVWWDGGKGTTDGDLDELDVVQGLYVEYETLGNH